MNIYIENNVAGIYKSINHQHMVEPTAIMGMMQWEYNGDKMEYRKTLFMISDKTPCMTFN